MALTDSDVEGMRMMCHCSVSSGGLHAVVLPLLLAGLPPRADFALSKCALLAEQWHTDPPALLTEQWHAAPPATDLCDDNGTCVGSGTPCNFLTRCCEDLDQCIPNGQDCWGLEEW